MASARDLVTTRCSLPCRPMRWYGPVHGSPPASRLFLGVLDPLLQPCWDLFWVWEIHRICLRLFSLTGTSPVALPSPSFPPRWTNTFGDWTQTWPVLRLI